MCLLFASDKRYGLDDLQFCSVLPDAFSVSGCTIVGPGIKQREVCVLHSERPGVVSPIGRGEHHDWGNGAKGQGAPPGAYLLTFA